MLRSRFDKMFGRDYLQRLKSLLDFDFKLLNPWKNGPDNTKLSKRWKPESLNLKVFIYDNYEISRFIASFVSPLLLILIMTSFVYYEWDTLSLATVAENVAFASE